MGEINWIDLGIVVVIGYHLYKGYRTGFSRQLFGIIGILAAVYLAMIYYEEFGRILQGFLGLSLQLSNVIAFGAILMVVSGGLSFLGVLFSHVLGALFLGQFDRLGGASLGLLKGAVLIYILLLILGGIPLEGLHAQLETSELADKFMTFAPFLYHSFERYIPVELPDFSEFRRASGYGQNRFFGTYG